MLAALRGKMLRLAVEKADGAFTNFLPISGLERVVGELGDAPEGFELLCRFFCLPGEREQIEPLARFMFSSYVTVPVYAAFYEWLGHGEAIAEMRELWAAKDRQGAAAAAPWELIEEMFILGTPDEMRARLERVRRRRDHAARADADLPARGPGRADRGAGAALSLGLGRQLRHPFGAGADRLVAQFAARLGDVDGALLRGEPHREPRQRWLAAEAQHAPEGLGAGCERAGDRGRDRARRRLDALRGKQLGDELAEYSRLAVGDEVGLARTTLLRP